MKIQFGRTGLLVAAVASAVAVLAIALVVALGVRAVVAGPGASPDPPNPGHAWDQVEGHGSGGGTYWLGTTTSDALELRVNGSRALRVEPSADLAVTGPNVIAGYMYNAATTGVLGATIGGGGDLGHQNVVTDDQGTVAGGFGNRAGDDAGTTNDATSATVGGGLSNVAGSGGATVAGGDNNFAFYLSAVGGGVANNASGSSATIAGGWFNTASGGYATIGGGANNNSGTGSYPTVGGGQDNTAQNAYATVSGGLNNMASGNRATIGGGDSNVASSNYATVGGGQQNTAGDEWATVPGGASNTAAADYSFAAGRRAKANHNGAFVWADSTDADFLSERADQFRVRAEGGVRFDDGAKWVDIRDDTTDLITTSTGGHLTLGGIWTDSSDADRKENFTPVDGQEVLASLAEIPITTWNSKAQDPSIRHMGPTAQDFYAAFDLGEDELHIASLDSSGVALAAIQGLYELVQGLEAENASLQQRLDDLEARVTALEGGAPRNQGSETGLSSIMPTGSLALAGLLVVGGLVLVQRRRAGGQP